MMLGTHNSWTFLTPQKWWMKLIRFTAQCQEKTIQEQYEQYNTRFFDLRVKFTDNTFTMSHGIIKYQYTKEQLFQDLKYLHDKDTLIYIRVIHEIRNINQIELTELMLFRQFCQELEQTFYNIRFCNGSNLLKENRSVDYKFQYEEPSCEELYASVQPPKIDDICPKHYAKKHNHDNIIKGTDKEVLMIDFVNIQ